MKRTQTSYKPVLERACRIFQPKRIVEWGPGTSTTVLAKACPGAKILSVEHDPRWYRDSNARHGHWPNVSMALKEEGYVTYPLAYFRDQDIGLAFVDGKGTWRVDCMVIAYLMLGYNGVMVLHDANRKEYQIGLEVYPYKKYYADHFTTFACKDAETLEKMNAG